MIVYHRTDAPDTIVSDGFHDGLTSDGTGVERIGVWVSDRALGEEEGAFGSWVIVVEVDVDVLEPWEWIEPGKPFREFLVPAEVLNEHPIVEVLED